MDRLIKDEAQRTVHKVITEFRSLPFDDAGKLQQLPFHEWSERHSDSSFAAALGTTCMIIVSMGITVSVEDSMSPLDRSLGAIADHDQILASELRDAVVALSDDGIHPSHDRS